MQPWGAGSRCDCCTQAVPGLNKDFEGAARNLRVFTEAGWSGCPEGTDDRTHFARFQPFFVPSPAYHCPLGGS